ncbi:MAG: chemotaxis protein CheW [Armatimonadota bacterium]
MNDYLDLSELLEVYHEEADEQLQHLDEGVLALEKNPSNTQLVNEIFRAAHTLKGSSATMGFEEIASLTHAMENLLDKLRSGKQKVTQETINAILKSVDVLRTLVQHTRCGTPSEGLADEALASLKAVSEDIELSEVKAERPSAGLDAPSDDCTRIEVRIAEGCGMPSVRAFMAINILSGKGEIVAASPGQDNLETLEPGGVFTINFRPSAPMEEVLAELGSICEVSVAVAERVNGSAEAPRAEADSQTHAMQTVRVGVDRLDNLMNLVGELSIDRARIGQVEGALAERYEGDALVSGLGEVSLHLGRVINELQEQITKIRMLPVDQVFNRFPRMVRDLAQKAGKKVNLVVSGNDTELDRSILQDIVDPITHLLRNAVDHGIERPEERLAAGKPECATVILSARHEENRIVIAVEDDGRGISVESVKQSAIAKGIVSPENAERMSEKECLQLIFAAGVSTAKKVTDVSGRGVGMDVVKSNIERLSGTIDVQTEVGVGTHISLRLPLTLAIAQAMLTSAQGRIFAVPLTSVVETSQCRREQISTIEGRPVLQLRGSVLPLVDMESVFPCRCSDERSAKDETILVVVRAGGQQIGLAVDGLIGEQEIVIKSLGSYLGQIDGISGAALLGDGKIALIVDVAGLPGILERDILTAA